MFSGLTLINFSPEAQGALQLTHSGHFFVLKTCQRLLVLGYYRDLKALMNNPMPKSIYYESKAYSYLLETMCGLHSKVMAENEVANQFKDAYRQFAELKLKNTTILRIIEKLFKDYKYIRREHLMGIGTKSYSSIIRNIVMKHTGDRSMTILGSGQMAEDLIKISYRKFSITVIARNQSRLNTLSENYGVSQIHWADRHMISHIPTLVNTIGSSDVSIFGDFHQKWSRHTGSGLLIDLGEPSPFSLMTSNQDHQVFDLAHVLTLGSELSKRDLEKVNKAFDNIRSLALSREEQFAARLDNGHDGAFAQL